MKKIILLILLPIMFSIAQDAKGIRYGESFISNEVKVIVDSLGTTQINKSDSTKSYVFSSSDMTTGFNLYGDAAVTADDTVSFPTANDQIMCLYATSTLGKTFKGSVTLSGSGTVYIYITDNVFNNDVYSSEITLSNTPTEYSVSTTFNVEDRAQVRFFLARISGATATAVTATGWKIQDRTDPIYATEYDIELINSELSPIISLPDTTSITTGYVPKKQADGTILWQPDISTSGSGTFNPDGVTIDTTALGLARVLPALKTKWDSVSVKQDHDTDLDDLADGELTASKVGGVKDADYGDVTVSGGAWAVEDNSHNHTIANVTGLQDTIDALQNAMIDTLSIGWGVMDTVITGSLSGWKVPYDITIIEVSAYTDANTTTFNLEERGETTPNTAGTDVMGSDLVADTDQQETTTFSNANIAKDAWLVPTISATGDVANFTISVRYIKQ